MVLKTESLTWDETFLSLHLREDFQKEQNQTDLMIPKVWSRPGPASW